MIDHKKRKKKKKVNLLFLGFSSLNSDYSYAKFRGIPPSQTEKRFFFPLKFYYKQFSNINFGTHQEGTCFVSGDLSPILKKKPHTSSVSTCLQLTSGAYSFIRERGKKGFHSQDITKPFNQKQQKCIIKNDALLVNPGNPNGLLMTQMPSPTISISWFLPAKFQIYQAQPPTSCPPFHHHCLSWFL